MTRFNKTKLWLQKTTNQIATVLILYFKYTIHQQIFASWTTALKLKVNDVKLEDYSRSKYFKFDKTIIVKHVCLP